MYSNTVHTRTHTHACAHMYIHMLILTISSSMEEVLMSILLVRMCLSILLVCMCFSARLYSRLLTDTHLCMHVQILTTSCSALQKLKRHWCWEWEEGKTRHLAHLPFIPTCPSPAYVCTCKCVHIQANFTAAQSDILPFSEAPLAPCLSLSPTLCPSQDLPSLDLSHSLCSALLGHKPTLHRLVTSCTWIHSYMHDSCHFPFECIRLCATGLLVPGC
jgi:hypothetical protein